MITISRNIGSVLQRLTFLLIAAEGYDCPSHRSGTQVLHDLGANMTGKVVVINGGDSGISLGGATALASAGARLIFLGYSTAQANDAMKNITATTGSTNMVLIDGFDLSSFKNVRDTASKVLVMTETIDVLVLDAGCFGSPKGGKHNITENGVEFTFQVNFLGHVLLTEELLPALRRAKGRVVFTSSVSGSYTQSKTKDLPPAPVEVLDVCGMSGLPDTCVQDAKQVEAVVTHNAPAMPGYGVASLAFYSYVVTTVC
jgi:NAD(P)-dependent dehydrogenase (short-subunit alcohol dehydrogenase family)